MIFFSAKIWHRMNQKRKYPRQLQRQLIFHEKFGFDPSTSLPIELFLSQHRCELLHQRDIASRPDLWCRCQWEESMFRNECFPLLSGIRKNSAPKVFEPQCRTADSNFLRRFHLRPRKRQGHELWSAFPFRWVSASPWCLERGRSHLQSKMRQDVFCTFQRWSGIVWGRGQTFEDFIEERVQPLLFQCREKTYSNLIIDELLI